MSLEKDLDTISSALFDAYNELHDGLPDGSNSEWGYDEELVQDIAQAVLNWRGRQKEIAEPYVVWYFNGLIWEQFTDEKYQEDAYKDWYKLTEGGKVKSDPSSETYYFLGRADLELKDRHDPSEIKDEDNFSIKYLLSKSFG